MTFAIAVWIGLAAAVISALIVGWRARHGMLISAVAFIAVTAVWVVAKIASDHDYHDADGWVDCWPSCTALQRAVGISLIGGAIFAAALAIAFVIAVARRGKH
jgi:hypothetical protein